MSQTELTQSPDHLAVLLAGPISHTSIQVIDYMEMYWILPDLSTIYSLDLIECFNCFVGSPDEYKVVLFYLRNSNGIEFKNFYFTTI